MPTFKFRCTKCGYAFEEFIRPGIDEEPQVCPKCGEKVEKVINWAGAVTGAESVSTGSSCSVCSTGSCSVCNL